MTVARSNSYCTIEDAWGGVFSTPAAPPAASRKGTKANRKAKRTPQGSCHLYERPAPVDDIFSRYEPFDKTKWSRTQAPLMDTNGVPRREQDAHVDIYPDRDEYDITEEPAPQTRPPAEESPIGGGAAAALPPTQTQTLIEFATFVFAGLLLIVILEQMIQVGLKMRAPF